MNRPPDEELESLLAAYSETQDQLLAILALMQAAQNVFDLKHLLHLLTEKTRNLLETKTLFFLVETQDGEIEFFSSPPESVRLSELYPNLTQFVVDTRAQRLSPCYLLATCPLRAMCHLTQRLPDGSLCSEPNYPFYVFAREFKNPGRVYLGFSTYTPAEAIHPLLRLGQLIVDQASLQIANIFLHRQIVAETRLETEMQLAQEVQTRLLPKTLPDLSALGLEAAVYFHPASLIGGDFYDFALSSARGLTFTVGDISGKGMPAALLMVMALTALRTKANTQNCASPGEILTQINRELYGEFIRTGGFATVFYARFDPRNSFLEMVNAGHSPVVLCPARGDARLLGPDGPPVGVLPTREYFCQSVLLQPGDVVVVGTDGFSEAENPAQAMFGNDRFLHLIEEMRDATAEQIKDRLIAETRAFAAGHPQSDDQTLIVLKYSS